MEHQKYKMIPYDSRRLQVLYLQSFFMVRLAAHVSNG